MDDEIRSLRSWDGTGKIYSEETVQMLQDEIAQLQARVTELVEQANAAYGPYQQKVNYLQNLVSMKNDALSSYAEFYGRAASFCGLPEDALPSGQTDAIILQRLAEHAEIARLRGMVEQLVENSGDLHQLTNEIARLREAQRWIPVSERLPEDMTEVLVLHGLCVTTANYYHYCGLLSKHGWYQIDGMKLGVSWATHWMPLPEPLQEDDNENNR